MSNKLWGGRFKKRTDPQFERFSSSFKWDYRLLPYDLKIDAAHVRALRGCGVLTARESARLLSAIAALGSQERRGTLKLNEAAEDVHSAVHEALRHRVGPLADKLHAARSRNDLVSQSTRLYCKAHALGIISLIRQLQGALVAKAYDWLEVLVPGMTHLQNAQALSLGHIVMAYVEMLERSTRRFELAVEMADICVLGSGALAGVNYPLDQRKIARELGLSRVTDNSYDVAGDRDFALHLASCVAFLGIHLSRMAEDLLIGQTKEFSMMDINEAFCTGSSMMPQKKNADFVELVRGAGGVFVSNLVGFLTVLKGLPTSYNRDLQWDKKFLFDSVENCEEILAILAPLFRALKVNSRRANELLKDESLYATDLADYLVTRGVPFASAHEQVGRIVSFAEKKGLPISKIGFDLLKQFAPAVDGGVYALFDAGHSVKMKKTQGSTHPREVRKQIRAWKKKLVSSPYLRGG